jgi:RNA polymerase sigma factor (sigma-70 family)
MNELTMPDDSRLLADWADDQDQGAFTALVQKYQTLVFGAALRRLDQPEAARDVCQQVFSLVASRARLLIGHANIGGWLYRTTTRMAGQLRRGERRRQERHEIYSSESPAADGAGAQWLFLEKALETLGHRDREALVLHYFQDLSYPEMAAALGIEQGNARQRISRALERLGALLRREGFAGKVPALLASAAAWSATVDAAMPATAAALTATASPALGFTFSAILSHTACKIAAGVVVAAALPWLFQWAAPATSEGALVGRAGGTVPAEHFAPTAGDVQAYEGLHETRLQANRRAAELSFLVNHADSEIIESLGSVEDQARKAGRAARVLMKSDKDKPPEPNTPEWDKLAAEVVGAAENIPKLLATARNLTRIERDATKAGRFYATFFSELLELDDATKGRLEENLRAWTFRMQREGLALPQRPREETGDWDVRRVQATDEQIKVVVGMLPRKALEQYPEVKKLSISDGPIKREDAVSLMNFLCGQRQ